MARPGLRKHPKFLLLRELIQECEAHTLGHLELLWETGYETGKAEIGSPKQIELSAGWDGKPEVFFKSALDCGGDGAAGFIEEVPGKPGRYQIHDLFDHAPEYVASRQKREDERKVVKVCDRCGAEFRSQDRRSRYCSHTCRQGAYLDRHPRIDNTDGRVTDRSVTVTGRSVKSDGCDGLVTDLDGTPAPAPAPLDTSESNKTSTIPSQGSGEAGSNGTGKKPRKKKTYPATFEDWYKAYPRPVAKEEAFKAYVKAGKRIVEQSERTREEVVDFLLERATAYAASGIVAAKPDFIPHPATWLNKGRYYDPPGAWAAPVGEHQQLDLSMRLPEE